MFTFQRATPDDADQIARILIKRAKGLAEHLLDGLIPGVNSADILAAALIKGEGAYRTDNVICSRDEERLTGLLFAYPASEHKVPPLMASLLPGKRLAPFRLLLEKSVPDSLYLNTLWMEDKLWNNGGADALMLETASLCRLRGFRRISLFCWNDDDDEMRFFARNGFAIAEHLEQEAVPVTGHDKGASILCKNLEE